MIGKMIALDWRSIKVYQIRGLFLPVAIFIFGYFLPLLVIPMSVFMFMSFSINPFAVEEKGDLNHLYLTLPVSRKEIVTGRYLFSLIAVLCGIALGTLMMPLANMVSVSKWFIGIEGYIVIIAFSYLIYAFFSLFIFPILFRFGYNKGKFWGFYLPVFLFAFFFSSYITFSAAPEYSAFTLNLLMKASENLFLVSGSMIAIATILLILSYIVSLKAYSNRDF